MNTSKERKIALANFTIDSFAVLWFLEPLSNIVKTTNMLKTYRQSLAKDKKYHFRLPDSDEDTSKAHLSR